MRTRKSRRLRPLGRGKVLTHTFRRSGLRYFRLTVRNPQRQISSKTRRIVVAEAPAPAPTLAPAPTPSPAVGVSLEQVDGGLGWYGSFANPLPTDPGYLPIGVWLQGVQTQAHIENDKDFGLNTYIGVADPEAATKRFYGQTG